MCFLVGRSGIVLNLRDTGIRYGDNGVASVSFVSGPSVLCIKSMMVDSVGQDICGVCYPLPDLPLDGPERSLLQ